jgi:hypothetical protein
MCHEKGLAPVWDGVPTATVSKLLLKAKYRNLTADGVGVSFIGLRLDSDYATLQQRSQYRVVRSCWVLNVGRLVKILRH